VVPACIILLRFEDEDLSPIFSLDDECVFYHRDRSHSNIIVDKLTLKILDIITG
jgi:hypothetical protein